MLHSNGYDENTYKWLKFMLTFGTDRIRIWNLIEYYSDISSAYDEISNPSKTTIFYDKEIQKFNSINNEQIENIINYCNEKSIGILCYSDENFPDRFKRISTPPSVLFYRGDISLLEEDYIFTIVGTRKPSDYSFYVAENITAELAKNGFVIASSFALGTDIKVHLTAVRNGGKTIAFLPCGIGFSYPKENMAFVDEILKNGLFISEYLPNSKPMTQSFSSRNRLLSAVSMGTLVIEATEKSGTLNTVSHATLQGKDLFTIPPRDIFDRRYFGNIRMLRDGVTPIFSAKDICDEYFGGFSHKLTKGTISDYIVIDPIVGIDMPPKKKAVYYDIEVESKPKNGLKVASPAPEEFSSVRVKPSGLSDEENIIYELLEKENKALTTDEISVISGLEITVVADIIMLFEVDGIVITTLDMKYKLN